MIDSFIERIKKIDKCIAEKKVMLKMYSEEKEKLLEELNEMGIDSFSEAKTKTKELERKQKKLEELIEKEIRSCEKIFN